MPEQDPYRYFRVEAAELVERLAQAALEIDKGATPAGGIAALLRHAHTLKGAARVVKQVEIADHAHAIEDVMSTHRAGGDVVPRECAPLLLASLDAITLLLGRLVLPAPAASARPPPSIPGKSASGNPGSNEEPAATLRAEVGDVEAVVSGLGEALVELEALETPLGLMDQVRQLADQLGNQLAAPRRADPQKLRALIERSQRLAEDLRMGLGGLDSGLRQGAQRLRRQLEQTHGAAERMRLVPASSIFTSLERAVYDAARDVAAHVTFITSGGDIKLESHVLVVARGALLHVVRNCVAHGRETQAARLQLGKPAGASIWLSVSRRGREVVFTCRDDGPGVDVERVRQVVLQREPMEAGASDEQLLERLLQGGISTAGGVTRLSGRGVGLDVVRAASEQLGGGVSLTSTPGQGLSVELRVPLSVATIAAVAVECDGRTLSIPLERVVEVVRLAPTDITRAGTRESVCHQGQVLPFSPLARALGSSHVEAPRSWSALIVTGAGGRVAVGVERLLGARTVVIRPLPDIARASAVVAGAALDSLGNPQLVLDADALVAAVHGVAGVLTGRRAASRPILVIDDSLTTRMLEQSILESAGYQVTLATSGEEGLQKAREGSYALFLVDVEMPGIDGFTFVDRVRHDPELANTPAVLVSSRSAPEDLARGKQVGAHGYIVKGRFDQRELLGMIERLVGS